MKKYRGYIIRRESVLIDGKLVKEWRAYFEFPVDCMLASTHTLRELKEYIDEHISRMPL